MSRSGAQYASLNSVLNKTSWVTGLYYVSDAVTGIAAGPTLANATVYLLPFWVPKSGARVDRMGIQITTPGAAGSVTRLGLYVDNGAGNDPTLLLDAGTIDTTQVAGYYEIAVNQAVPVGLLWTVVVPQGAPATQPALTSPASGRTLQLFPGTNNTRFDMPGPTVNAAAAGALNPTLHFTGQGTLPPIMFVRAA